jgi:hypothetical protein
MQADQSIADIYTAGITGLYGWIHWIDFFRNPSIENIILIHQKSKTWTNSF